MSATSSMESEKPSTSGKAKSRGGGKHHAEVLNDQFRHSFTKVAAIQLVSAVAVTAGLWFVPRTVGVNLIEQPIATLSIAVVTALPVSLIAFSTVSLRPKNTPVTRWWAMTRGLLSVPVGVLVATFIAFVFGAPLTNEYVGRTYHWALFMTVLVIVPGATVLGASKPTWRRIFANTAPTGPIEVTICIPAHGAAIGAWVGAWPMPLDWERPWQEWPVCCTIGAFIGYIISLLGCLLWTYRSLKRSHRKQE